MLILELAYQGLSTTAYPRFYTWMPIGVLHNLGYNDTMMPIGDLHIRMPIGVLLPLTQ